MRIGSACCLAALSGALGCRDLSRFQTNGDGFEGPVVAGSFVRSGIGDQTRMCVTLDTDHLQDAPGTITMTDGRFHGTPLRPIPQIWHDPLSTLAFGEGRVQNLVYAASPDADADASGDILVVVSLMQSSGVEVRLLRGAPTLSEAGAPEPGSSQTAALFGVFTLTRQPAPCQ
jgi:hypothetical protein